MQRPQKEKVTLLLPADWDVLPWALTANRARPTRSGLFPDKTLQSLTLPLSKWAPYKEVCRWKTHPRVIIQVLRSDISCNIRLNEGNLGFNEGIWEGNLSANAIKSYIKVFAKNGENRAKNAVNGLLCWLNKCVWNYFMQKTIIFLHYKFWSCIFELQSRYVYSKRFINLINQHHE